jgi:hypothetical protein
MPSQSADLSLRATRLHALAGLCITEPTQGTLAQMYLMEPGQPDYLVLGLLLAVFGGATIYGSVDTLGKIRGKKLSARCVYCALCLVGHWHTL